MFKKQTKSGDNVLQEQQKLLEKLNEQMRVEFINQQALVREMNNSVLEQIKLYNNNVVDSVKALSSASSKELEIINQKMTELTASNITQMEKLIAVTSENLSKLQQSNEKKLDEMRMTVDEKLNATLQDRLNKSFAIVSDQLQAVTKGLGEMQSLASGVGDLKKVINNVKTRGTFGEVQLNGLLEQMLAPNQFASQVNTNPENNDRVDFVIYLPGKDDKNVMLPVDAKFPMEDYVRLVDAMDSGDVDLIAKSQKALEARIKEEAKNINKKYICIPNTTDFAIMYLATEGLYSDVIRNTALVEKLQQELRILICGPTTLSALLNSLQMGFKTLAIEKRSAEIWNMLSVFRKEFATYVELLTKTQKKLGEVSSTIEDATKKSQKITKQLSKVEEIGDGSED
ncbi:MAG: DNA recombination protein RmuC [Christensenellales bacterium]